MENGIHRDLTYEQYHAIDAIRFSRLKHMATSAKMYAANPSYGSKAMVIGSAVHTSVLEPERFAIEYTTYPGRRAGKAWEAFRDATEATGKSILSAPEYQTCVEIGNAIRRAPEALEIIEATEHEVSAVWTDVVTGRKCKSRMDCVSDTILADVKSCRDPSPHAFSRQIASLRYVHQLAFYSAGLANVWPPHEIARSTYLIAAQNCNPWDVCVYSVRYEDLGAAWRQVAEWLTDLDECIRQQSFPGISGGKVLDLDVAPWTFGEAETEVDLEGLE